MAVQTGKGGITDRSMAHGKAVSPRTIREEIFAGQYFRQVFPSGGPVLSDTLGSALPTGVTGNINRALFVQAMNAMQASYHIKGAGQTILGPWEAGSNGYLDAGLDNALSEGVEYLFGNGAAATNPFARNELSPASFVKLDFSIGTVANALDLALGFRKINAFNADLEAYQDIACLNMQAGTVNVQTILDDGATATTDTGLTLADAVRMTFEVQVRGRQAVFLVNGAEVSVPRFNFDVGEIIVPICFFLQGAGGGAGAFAWFEIEMGPLWLVGRDGSRR